MKRNVEIGILSSSSVKRKDKIEKWNKVQRHRPLTKEF